MTQPPSSNRRVFLGSLMAAPFLAAACRKDYGRFFDIEWDEEVELHSGNIITVYIKRTFERVKNMRHSRWQGKLRATEIGFDAGGNIGYYKRKFNGYTINFINFNQGYWYLSFTELIFGINELPKEIIFQNSIPTLIISQNGLEITKKTWQEIPYFEKRNIMPVTPDSEGISQFNKKKLTIPMKMAHWKKFPRAAGDHTFINVGNQQPLPQ